MPGLGLQLADAGLGGDRIGHVAFGHVINTEPRDMYLSRAAAMEAGVPENVCHIISAHAGEGDMVKRTVEAYVVHHADFMTFLPFKHK